MSTQNQTSQSDWQKRKIGALWRQEGKDYLTGQVASSPKEAAQGLGKRVIVFENDDKRSDKSPDFVLYESQPMDSPNQPQQEVKQEQEEAENLL
jgi:hypothetical protein